MLSQQHGALLQDPVNFPCVGYSSHLSGQVFGETFTNSLEIQSMELRDSGLLKAIKKGWCKKRLGTVVLLKQWRPWACPPYAWRQGNLPLLGRHPEMSSVAA